jgi:hypothetical protein
MAPRVEANVERVIVGPEKPLSAVFFFPEAIGVAACVLFSPWWCVRLAHQGHLAYAGLVLFVAVVGTFGVAWFMVKRRRVFAWLVMVAILFAFLLIDSSLPPAERFMRAREPSATAESLLLGHQGGHYRVVGVVAVPPNHGVHPTACAVGSGATATGVFGARRG